MKMQQPEHLKKTLHRHFLVLQSIRNFFLSQGFLDVMTPPAVTCPGMEPHIHTFQLARSCNGTLSPFYLHTSPEFCMKELLALQFEKIFTLTHTFRDEPSSATHRFQFTMLEWYRAHTRYEQIMDDCQGLITAVTQALSLPNLKIQRLSVQAIFQQLIGVDILQHLEIAGLQQVIQSKYPHLIHNSEDWKKFGWEDYFFLLFLNEIEPRLKNMGAVLLYEFPAPLAALSTIKPQDPRVAERFEIYLNGVEICNAYNELTNAKEQRRRFEASMEQKQRLYGHTSPMPERFLANLERGMPPAAGIALGVERLIMALTQETEVFWD
ncbi:MAG: EF-P lysine aminoacylase GenX [Bdellovibrionales bacterium GWA2_49_15]|nr:MAG: EF-P lysine aminoacylase GenX [Bdellovibrionales bacterium GWA2_49_15]